jgi:hypothetical protein
MLRATQIIRELDPNHPIEITQAPRGTIDTLRPYNAACDIIAADIYPVGYPPGTHSLLPNKEISMVGDFAKSMMQVADGKMPVWMTLQISWSGVIKPGKTLRFPTFAEERFMTYQAIINGARGLIFFGGHIPKGHESRRRRARLELALLAAGVASGHRGDRGEKSASAGARHVRLEAAHCGVRRRRNRILRA